MLFLKKYISHALFIILMGNSNHLLAENYNTVTSQEIHKKAEISMSEGNFAISYCLWEPLAQQGDSKAQFNLGWMYHNGYGLAIDDEIAFNWWIKSAEQGYVPSYYALADLYMAGFGVDKDPDIAFGWYIAAAKLGHEPSLEIIHNLALSDDKLGQKYFSLLVRDDPFLLGNTYQVKVAKANVRKGPGKSFKVIKTLKQGDLMVPIKTQGQWTQVALYYTAQKVWVYSSLIEKKPEQTQALINKPTKLP